MHLGQPPDPEPAGRLYRNALREAIVVGAVWAVALIWTVSYCYLHGYQHAPESWMVQIGWATERNAEPLQVWWGLPEWVFKGIFLPWILCTAFTIVFCLVVMKDDDLGAEGGQEETHGP